MTWTQADIDELISELRTRRSDTTTVEVKAAAGGTPELGPTLSAFANMPQGGTIILGLDEAAGLTPVGLQDLAGLEAAVASQARNALLPPVAVDFATFSVDGMPVLVAIVQGLPLAARPARYRSQAYLRQSDGDYTMSQQEIAQIELQKSASTRPRSDMTAVAGSGIGDLDESLATEVLKVARHTSRRHAGISDEQLLRRLNVITGEGNLTKAGLYALGSYPQQFEPSLSITAAVRMPRESGTRVRDLTHFTGPIPVMLADAVDWVSKNTHSYLAYDARGHGFDRPELPLRAVREIIANALIHRSLDAITDTKRVEIRLLDDQLTINNPGGLWGISADQLGHQGGKSAVNLALYDLCKLVRMEDGSRVIEGEGGGIREAMLALREAEMRTPHFIDKGVSFTALISRHTLLSDDDLDWLSRLPEAGRLTSEQRAILASMRRGTQWTNASVRQRFAPLDSVQARRWLQQLVDVGLAEQMGSRGNAAYRLRRSQTPRSADALADQPHLQLEGSSSPAPAQSNAVDLGPNATAVWDALTESMTFADLVATLEPPPVPEPDALCLEDHALSRTGHIPWEAGQPKRDLRKGHPEASVTRAPTTMGGPDPEFLPRLTRQHAFLVYKRNL